MIHKKPILAACLAGMLAMMLLLTSCNAPWTTIMEHSWTRLKTRIFHDIDEFNALDDITQKHDPNNDRYLDGMEWEQSYCGSMTYEGNTYIVHAYDFASNHDAITYFYNAFGNQNNNQEKYKLEQWYCLDVNLKDVLYVVYYRDKALLVYGEKEHETVDFINYLADFLTVEVNNPGYGVISPLDKLFDMLKS